MYTGFFAKFGADFVSERRIAATDSAIEDWLDPQLRTAVSEGKAAWICWPYSSEGQATDIEKILNDLRKNLLESRGVRQRGRLFRPNPIRCEHQRDNLLALLFVEAR